MKKFQVSEKCNGCGMCTVTCDYLTEDENGKAQPVEGKVISDDELEKIKKVIEECPVQALKIIESGMTKKDGQAGIDEIVNILKNKSNAYNVKRITREDVPFDVEYWHFDFPYMSYDEGDAKFGSERAAKSAARREFVDQVFCESAYKPKLKELFVDYKVRQIKKYYSESADSVYTSYIQDCEKILKNVKGEIEELANGTVKIPDSWCKVSLPVEDNYMYQALCDYEIQSERSEIISDLKSDRDYASADWYVDWMRFDSSESYEYGMFRTKTVEKWYYTGFNRAVEHFEKNLLRSAKHKKRNIEEFASNQINHFLQDFEKRIREMFKEKVTELEQYLKN